MVLTVAVVAYSATDSDRAGFTACRTTLDLLVTASSPHTPGTALANLSLSMARRILLSIVAAFAVAAVVTVQLPGTTADIRPISADMLTSECSRRTSAKASRWSIAYPSSGRRQFRETPDRVRDGDTVGYGIMESLIAADAVTLVGLAEASSEVLTMSELTVEERRRLFHAGIDEAFPYPTPPRGAFAGARRAVQPVGRQCAYHHSERTRRIIRRLEGGRR